MLLAQDVAHMGAARGTTGLPVGLHVNEYIDKVVIPIILLVTAGFVVILDQFCKVLIRRLLAPGQSFTVLGFLKITHVKNPGAAFGLMPNHQLVFMITTVVVVIFIFFYYGRLKPQDRLVKLALGLELGGAIGNLVDRIFFGKVTDFIDFRIWPVFNVADIAIVVGLLVLGWALYSSQGEEEKLGTETE